MPRTGHLLLMDGLGFCWAQVPTHENLSEGRRVATTLARSFAMRDLLDKVRRELMDDEGRWPELIAEIDAELARSEQQQEPTQQEAGAARAAEPAPPGEVAPIRRPATAGSRADAFLKSRPAIP